MNKDLERNREASASGAGESVSAAGAVEATREREAAEALVFIEQMIGKGELDPVDAIDLCFSAKGR